jgi:hypothetical protein
MAKFSGAQAQPADVQGPVATTDTRVLTHEGGVGWARDAKSDLFLLAVTNMVGEDTFYEARQDRDERFRSLVAAVVAEDPAWVARFVPYLRDTMQMRSAAVVLACEYVRAGGPHGRAVVDSACSRPDEPAEVLGYWASRYGRRFPQPVKRGVADAAVRLYDEKAVLRYDGQSRSWRMGDVIELVHPKPKAEWQQLLFRFLLDNRHHNDGMSKVDGSLPLLAAARRLEETPDAGRRALIREPGVLAEAGFSWERLSGWLPGGMDAEAWEAVVPSMGYMALLRNLRNFDEAGVSDEVAEAVGKRLADPDEVARSRQFPMRFLSAWKATRSLRWGSYVEKALQLSLANVPVLAGRTLVMVDVSGSMRDHLSGRSELQRWEAAAVFGAALAVRNRGATLAAYDTRPRVVPATTSASVLRIVGDIGEMVGGGTNTMACLHSLWDGHDRVVILTDEQAHDSGYDDSSIPLVYTFNLAGCAPAHLPSGRRGRYTFGGLTDAAFAMLPQLERHRDASWPF